MTGSTHNEWGYRDTRSFDTHYRLAKRLWDKIWLNIDKLFEYEAYGIEDAEVGFVAFGSIARSVKRATRILRSKGIKAGYIRLKTLWPLDINVLSKLCEIAKVVIVPELSLGQLVLDVERASNDKSKVVSYGKVGGGEPIYPSELIELVKKVLGL